MVSIITLIRSPRVTLSPIQNCDLVARCGHCMWTGFIVLKSRVGIKDPPLELS